MEDLRNRAISKINDYISYMMRVEGSYQMKVELYYACCGKIHLAFDLGLISKDEKKELLRDSARAI